MTKRFLTIIFIFLSLCGINAQKNNKIEIVFVGTVHLTPSTTDIYKNKKIDLKSDKRQNEIREVVKKIVEFKPNQICVEYMIEDQAKYDSIFNAYKGGKYKLKDNERDLFGMQAALKLGLKSPTCVNYSNAKFNMDTVTNFASHHHQENILLESQEYGTRVMAEIDNNLTSKTLREFLVYINADTELSRNLSFYTNFLARIGAGSNYVGSDLVADWYSTTIHIYANILRTIKPTDKRILVLFGQGHVPILKHLFENNPRFTVISAETVLN